MTKLDRARNQQFFVVFVFSLLYEIRDFNQNKVSVFVMNSLGFNKISVVLQKIVEGIFNGILGVSFGVVSAMLLTHITLPSIVEGLGIPVDTGLLFEGVYQSWVNIAILTVCLVFLSLAVRASFTYLKIRNLHTSSFRFDLEA